MKNIALAAAVLVGLTIGPSILERVQKLEQQVAEAKTQAQIVESKFQAQGSRLQQLEIAVNALRKMQAPRTTPTSTTTSTMPRELMDEVFRLASEVRGTKESVAKLEMSMRDEIGLLRTEDRRLAAEISRVEGGPTGLQLTDIEIANVLRERTRLFLQETMKYPSASFLWAETSVKWFPLAGEQGYYSVRGLAYNIKGSDREPFRLDFVDMPENQRFSRTSVLMVRPDLLMIGERRVWHRSAR